RHQVRKGENLSQIADRYDSTIEKIKRFNGRSSNMLSITDVLEVPKPKE
ncbi:LysM peptidoglycan-binding domain-containing protein, partial [Candidatus Peregrinibacteria bacterium]|nr:LysM peptidoglycan-binding domain-containing protein [Candidatus Peregrinibacteria bacterium]